MQFTFVSKDCRHLDEQVLSKVRSENRILLTMDLDFGYLLAVSRERTPSVILFRLSDERSETVNSRLADVLERFKGPLEKGAIVSFGEEAIRVRSLPI